MTSILPTIHLRAIEPEDLDVLYTIENDTKVWNVSTTNVPYSRYVLYDYVANAKNDIYADKQVRMMIEDEHHNVVGIVDIINFDPKNMRAEVGIVIKQDYRNKGYIIRKTKRFAIPERAVYFLKTKRTAGGTPPPQNIFDRLTPVFT